MHQRKGWILRGILLLCFGLAIFFTCRLFSTAPGDRHGEVAPPKVSTSTPAPNITPAPEDAIAARARELLSEMTLSEKVGQMFFARCPEKKAVESVSQI